MKVIILAAGRGTRISREIDGKPKCTVPVEPGLPLIDYTVQLLNSRGIRDIRLIVGYEYRAIRQALAAYDVTYTVNPFFDVTNSLASLWFARDCFVPPAESYLILNGDVYLSAPALDQVLAETASPVMFYDSGRIEGADYKFQVTGGVLTKYGKDLSAADTTGEYVGCARFSGAYAAQFVERMNEMVDQQKHSVWWENVLYSLSHEQQIRVADLAGKFWAEVDYIEDYRRIMAYHQIGSALD